MDPQRRRRRALWRLPYLAKLIARPPRLPGVTDLLPHDPRFCMGDLPCGVRYVIYTNRKPRARALLRLVVRIGSLAEDEDQLGIAHLIEHMVFRGTPSFPANDLKRFLESCGLSWGADLNAETGMEHTTYSLDIPLKKNSTDLLAKGLLILKEFAFDALLRSEDIQKEKAVVEEEWRGRLGVEQRVEDQFWAEVFAGSRHSQRLPIGKMETLRSCPDERLRAFYRRWYRPHRMTILCIGDFGSNVVAKSLIQKAFADVKPPQDAETQFEVPPLIAHPRAAVVYRDQELTSYVLRIRFFFEETPRRTLGEMVSDMSRDLLVMALNRRLSALQLRPSAPFLSASAGEDHITQTCICLSISANVLKGNLLKAAEALGEVAASLARHGLSDREMELTKKFHATALDSVWAERHHVDSEDVLECAEEFILSGEQTRMCSDFMDVRLQREAMALLGSGPLADPQLQKIAAKLFDIGAGRWTIEAEMVDEASPETCALSPSQLQEALASCDRADVPPFAWLPGELLDSDAVQDQIGEPNPVVQTLPLEHLSAQHWVTATGSTVTWLRTDFEPDEILFQGLVPCGLSELGSPALRTACSCMHALRVMDGLGKMTKAQLQEFLADKNATVLLGVQMYSRTISGRCGASAKDLETALRLCSLHFLPANFTESSFEKVLEAMSQRIENREREPEYHFDKKLKEVTCGNDSFFHETTLQDVQDLRKMGLQGAVEMYNQLFSDPKVWSWVIVGAIPPDEEFRDILGRGLQPPAASHEEERRLPKARVPQFTPGGPHCVYSGLSDTARVAVCFEVDARLVSTARQRLSLAWLGDILETRLVEKMRMETGSTYSVSCSMTTGSTELAVANRRPLLGIDFACEPTAAQKHVDCMFQEIRRLTSGSAPVTSEELETCRKQERERLAVDERENRFWLGRLCTAVRRARCGTKAESWGFPAEGPQAGGELVPLEALNEMLALSAGFSDRITAVSDTDVQRMAEQVMDEKSAVVMLLPEKLGESSAKRRRCSE
ncbi:unnamed protein product [Symbiodinium natans]|uniref:Zinc protease pqqL n=1 Tax=Symbiodinium natans TaxID=878477 RepID=A0A812VGU9_9DINO|nr:unnamed protein product [Symbiodinium natans]